MKNLYQSSCDSFVNQLLNMADRKLCSANSNGTIIVWDLDTLTGKVLGTHEEGVNVLINLGDKVCSGGNDSCIKIWDVDTMTCIWSEEVCDDNIKGLYFINDRLFFASSVGDVGSYAVINNMINGMDFKILISHGDSPEIRETTNIVAIDDKLYTVSKKGIFVWDLNTFEYIKTLKGFDICSINI